jgi:ABC-2 type transport system permease protein
VPSIVSAEAIVRKTQFPRLVIPIATVLNAVFNLGLNLIVAFIFILASGVSPMWTWLLLPVLVLGVLVFTVAVAMIFSSLYPRFRDMGIIWAVGSTALFYATPVIYVLDRFHSETLRKVLSCNPMTVILELARKWIIDPHAAGPALAINSRQFLIIPLAIYVVICILAIWVFRREAPRIAEEL